MRELIATLAHDHPRWGRERIRGELLKLGLVVSRRAIQRYRRRGPASPSNQTWRTLLINHAHHRWAADLLTVQTLTFETLYLLVFIAPGRREVLHLNVTANPTAAWVWRQLIEATPWRRKPRHLLRDRDAVYGRDFRQRAQRIGIDAIATPIASPRAKAIIERFLGTLRRECLDHLIILNEQHLQSVLGEFVQYYNVESHTGHCASRRPCQHVGRSRGGCAHGQCSVACTTSTSEPPPRPGDPAPKVRPGHGVDDAGPARLVLAGDAAR